MQLNFWPFTLSHFSVILQYSFEIGCPQEHFPFSLQIALQFWHIWCILKQRYHCLFPGLAKSPHIWQTKSLRISATALLKSSKHDAILTNFSNVYKWQKNFNSTDSGQMRRARPSPWTLNSAFKWKVARSRLNIFAPSECFGNDIEINAMMNAFILRHVLHLQDRLFQIPKNE